MQDNNILLAMKKDFV